MIYINPHTRYSFSPHTIVLSIFLTTQNIGSLSMPTMEKISSNFLSLTFEHLNHLECYLFDIQLQIQYLPVTWHSIWLYKWGNDVSSQVSGINAASGNSQGHHDPSLIILLPDALEIVCYCGIHKKMCLLVSPQMFIKGLLWEGCVLVTLNHVLSKRVKYMPSSENYTFFLKEILSKYSK